MLDPSAIMVSGGKEPKEAPGPASAARIDTVSRSSLPVSSVRLLTSGDRKSAKGRQLHVGNYTSTKLLNFSGFSNKLTNFLLVQLLSAVAACLELNVVQIMPCGWNIVLSLPPAESTYRQRA